MKVNKTKEKIQLDAAELWVKNNCTGTFEYATGVGKTFVALQCILKVPKGASVLFLAEVTDREQTILDDIKKFNKIYGTNILRDYDVTFTCYQSAYKWEDKYFDVVVAARFCSH